ncbi:hypothetical protein Vafri_13103 [Volvox africanus]|uniref:Uncharacterized protein n=1 Tax=Volvox africanus TaxID=51714 RepID=A0A8J4F537_9CHLO|nr:hypothetical protein Vafri_13103 [Volvox africanus]
MWVTRRFRYVIYCSCALVELDRRPVGCLVRGGRNHFRQNVGRRHVDGYLRNGTTQHCSRVGCIRLGGLQGVRGAPATPSTANVLAVEEGSKPAGDNEPLIRSALSTDDVRGTVPVVVSEEHAAEDATRRLLEGPMLQSESNDASSRGLRCGEKGDVEMARSTLAAPSQPDG